MAQLPDGQPLGSLARKLLAMSRAQLTKFEAGQKQGLIEIADVHLPVDPPGDKRLS